MMRLIHLIQRCDPVRFHRFCAIAALLFLAVTVGGRYLIGPNSNQDFPQYYMGGVMARLGAWDSLYPIPHPGVQKNPGGVQDSDMKPRYALEADRRHVGNEVRYMQPPPFALLLVPLSFLTYPQAYLVWMIGLTLCVWLIALQAAKIYTLCVGRITHGAGIILLLIVISLSAHRWVRVMNMSPVMGVLIGISILSLLDRRHNLRGPLAMWLGGVAKYATGVLLPLYLVTRRWKALLILIGWSIISLLIALIIMGRAPFEEYLTRIAPTLKSTSSVPQNQALAGMLVRTTHSNPPPRSVRIPFDLARLLTIVGLLTLIFSRRRVFWNQPVNVFAAAASLLCWMLIFSPMFWEHYTTYTAPLWGWLAWEATRSRARLIVVIVIIALEYVPVPILVGSLRDPFCAHIMWGTILMLGLSIERSMRGAPIQPAVLSGH